MTLMLTPLQNIPLIYPGDDLVDILLSSLISTRINLEDNDILVITQKIVSKSEGRLVDLESVIPSKEAIELANRSEKDARLVELILQESKEVIRVQPGTIIVEHRLGFICANAGIDHSNVQGNHGKPENWVLLLPEDPDRSAFRLRQKIKVATGIRTGIAIIDSQGRAWRLGTVGMTIGLSGIPGLVDRRGWKDMFGYQLKITLLAATDGLAAAASLIMGEAAEGIPAVHIRGFPYALRESSLKEMLRPKENDLFR